MLGMTVREEFIYFVVSSRNIVIVGLVNFCPFFLFFFKQHAIFSKVKVIDTFTSTKSIVLKMNPVLVLPVTQL